MDVGIGQLVVVHGTVVFAEHVVHQPDVGQCAIVVVFVARTLCQIQVKGVEFESLDVLSVVVAEVARTMEGTVKLGCVLEFLEVFHAVVERVEHLAIELYVQRVPCESFCFFPL